MNRFIFTLACALLGLHLSAQKVFFIFIQHSSGQPFYVREGDKSFSSTAGGHIILSNLQDSTYELYIGFPKNAASEQRFTVPIHHKDRGFELKDMGGQWQLFDLQTAELIRPAAARVEKVSPEAKRSDSYSQLMADVVDDSTVLYANATPLDSMVVKKKPAARGSVASKTKKAQAGKKKVVSDSAALALAEPAPDKKDEADSTAANTVTQVNSGATGPDTAVAAIQKPGELQAATDSASVGVAKTDSTAVAVVNKPDSTAADSLVAKKEGPVPDTSLAAGNKTDTLAMPQGKKTDTMAVAAGNAPLGEKERVVVDSTRVAANKKDTIAGGSTVAAAQPATPDPKNIIRYGSENKEEGKEIIFLDRSSPVTDTIRILIPRL